MRIFVLLAMVLLALPAFAQTRQPAQITTQPSVTPQRFDKLDKSGNWIPLDVSRAISPVAYGAKCDGVTDDTTALKAWAAGATNRAYMVIPGVCIFKDTLTFATHAFGVTLDGHGHPGELRYTGTSTTIDLVRIGSNGSGSCTSKGWTINGLRIMSTTKMTAGDGLYIGISCVVQINNLSMGGNLDDGDSNLFNALHLDGGNTIYLTGANLRGSGDGIKVHGSSTGNVMIEPIVQQAQITHFKVGIHICGAVGGFIADNTDVLQNGTNVLIDQACTPFANTQLFFGPQFMSDVTNPTDWPGEPQIGVHVVDPGRGSTVIDYRGWLASATNQCFVIDNTAAPASGVPWVNFMGAEIGLCHFAAGGNGTAIENNSSYYKVSVTGSSFFTSAGGVPTIYNKPSAVPMSIQGIIPDQISANFNIVGPWSGAYRTYNGDYLVSNNVAGSSTSVLDIVAQNNTQGASIRLRGPGATTPDKYIRSVNGYLQFLNNGYNVDMLRLLDDGTMQMGGIFKTKIYTIATLPTCSAGNIGMRATVSDGQTTPTYRGAVSTTGAVSAAVYCTGSAWVYN